MLISICKSKIHRARITEANLNYEGSLTIDSDLMKAAGITPYEKVHVVNIANGNRLETYAIEGKSGSGIICLNGAAARTGVVGDLIIIICYGIVDEKEARTFAPRIVRVDKNNRIV
jgi:aspartate 1-decarboxylase